VEFGLSKGIETDITTASLSFPHLQPFTKLHNTPIHTRTFLKKQDQNWSPHSTIRYSSSIVQVSFI